MDEDKVTLFDIDGEKVDVLAIPGNRHMDPGTVIVYLGRKFARGGGPDNLYGPNEYGELMEEK